MYKQKGLFFIIYFAALSFLIAELLVLFPFYRVMFDTQGLNYESAAYSAQ